MTQDPVVPSTVSAIRALDSSFAACLRSVRERSGLTQRGLALRSSIGVRTIRDLESGRAHGRRETIQLLADGLRLAGAEREQFVQAGLSAREPASSVAGDTRPATALATAPPRSVNTLIGRETEVTAIVAAMADGRRRAVSLCGLPGVGKTRMAAEIAARLDAQLQWPVMWVGLDSGGLPASGPSLQSSLRWLAEGRVEDVSYNLAVCGEDEALLVLDGLPDADVLDGVGRLLAASPGLRVLTTARAPWHVTGCQPTVIAPLQVPEASSAYADLGELGATPAVAMLVDRLGEAAPGFTLSRRDADAVVRVCRRADGIPLVLEMLAAHVRVLGLADLADLPESVVLELSVPARIGVPAPSIAALFRTSLVRLSSAQRVVLTAVCAAGGVVAPVTHLAAQVGRRAVEVADDLRLLCGYGMLAAATGRSPQNESAGGPAGGKLVVPPLFRAFLSSNEMDSLTHVRGGCPTPGSSRILDRSAFGLTETEGETMSYKSTDQLRAAGLINGGPMAPELEQFFGSLTQQEVDVLVSTTSRLNAILPDVVAHSQEWSSPEATQEGFDAAMLCACGAWSGSGTNAN